MPASPELLPAWRAISAELRTTAGDGVFDVWLAGLEPLDWDGAVLHVAAPAATRTWIAERFGALLDRCAQHALGDRAAVALTTPPADPADPARPLPPAGGISASRSRAGVGGGGTGGVSPSTRQGTRPVRLIPRFRFDQFIIGDGNRHAHAAALAVAESPGHAYNPLFLWAPPGLGKTHLLHAIGNYVTEFDPSLTVRYTTTEAFTNAFLTALHDHALEDFKARHRDVDVLLVDDVQFLASKAKTEEEFFHTFNALHDAGRQLVVTADSLPRHLTGIETRLRERFEAGLVESLQPPDHATRVAILRKRADLDGVPVADPTLFELIAERVTDNVRALEGALIRIVAHGSLTHRPLDVALGADVLRDSHPAPETDTRLSPSRIQTTVANHFGLTVDELRSASRAARITWPRQLAIYLCRELTSDSLQRLGELFGGRNHATVLHACKRVGERTAASREDAAELDALTALLTDDGRRPGFLTD